MLQLLSSQCSFECFATHIAHLLLKLKRLVLFVMYSVYKTICCCVSIYYTFAAILTVNTALSSSSLFVIGDAFHYSANAYALCQ